MNVQRLLDFLSGRFWKGSGLPFIGEDGRTYQSCRETGARRLAGVQFPINPNIPRPRPPQAQEQPAEDYPLGVERFG